MKFISMILFSLLLIYGCAEEPAQVEETDEPTQMVLTSDVEQENEDIDVSAHYTADDCYTVIDGRVYDITEFIENSPEYKDSIDMDPDEFRSRLSMVCGTDGTIVFEELYGENHMRLDAYFVEDM